MTSRQLWVGAGRLEVWVAGFGLRHGGMSVESRSDQTTLTGADGAQAVLRPTFPPLLDDPAVDEVGTDGGAVGVAALVRNALEPRTVAVLLVRRGGYGCAVVHGPQVLASKVGSRYVQGRTAAGGWSQQRFARRRKGQADALVGSVTEVAQRVLLGTGAQWLVTGGDRPLLDDVLGDPRLRTLAGLPRGPHLDVPDPKFEVIKGLPERLRSIRITLDEP